MTPSHNAGVEPFGIWPKTQSNSHQTLCLCNTKINKSIVDIEHHRRTCNFTCYVNLCFCAENDVEISVIFDIVFCCRQCFGIFESKSALNSHQFEKNHFEVRKGEIFRKRAPKKFECGHCHKIFLKKYDYQIHVRTHNDERVEKCKFCEKKFCDPATLRKHIKYIHGKNELTEKPFSCRMCHKRFKYKHSLKAHLECQHQNGGNLKERKLFKCPMKGCMLSFTYKSNRNAHLKKYHPNYCPTVSSV